MNNIAALKNVGVEVEALTDEQKAVLNDLSPEEISLLSGIKSRLDEVSGDVEAHVGAVVGGLIF